MKTSSTASILLILILGCTYNAMAAPDDGQVRQHNGESQAWNDREKRWNTLDEFWKNYADRRGGYTWGHSNEYPEYDKVSEFDTFLVKTAKGNCLMQFFHSRWRRANDVQRWDDAFNEHACCPYVFD